MRYYNDRNFTNKVHETVAKEEIYKHLGWEEKKVDKDKLEYVDINHGIDYIFESNDEYNITVQERFKEKKYQIYDDCTLRYRRDHNKDESRHESEFYKIKADYLVYGILNQSKEEMINDKNKGMSSFIKYVIVDLGVLKRKIKEGRIKIVKGGHRSYITNDGNMIIPEKDNYDNSSSFVALDVKQLQELFGHEDIIIKQVGYY